MRYLDRRRSEGPGFVRCAAGAAREAGGEPGNRRQPPVLSGDAARRVRADQPRTRPYRSAAGGKRRVAAAGGRETVRHRPRLGQSPERRVAQNRGRTPALSDRSLPRQGDGPEYPGAALRERHVRADLESRSHRSCADHRRREARRRPSRQFLDRKSTRLNSSHSSISYAVFCLKKKKNMYFFLFYMKKKILKILK